MYLIGTVVNVTFDNLGGNESLGYSGSFSANYFCRICEKSKQECKGHIHDDITSHRTKKKYAETILSISQMHDVDLKETKGTKHLLISSKDPTITKIFLKVSQ